MFINTIKLILTKYNMEKSKIEEELICSIKNNDEITKETILKAQGIHFKDIPKEVIQYDDFGFVIRKNNQEQSNKYSLFIIIL